MKCSRHTPNGRREGYGIDEIIKSSAASEYRHESARILLTEGVVSGSGCPEGTQEQQRIAQEFGDAKLCNPLIHFEKKNRSGAGVMILMKVDVYDAKKAIITVLEH